MIDAADVAAILLAAGLSRRFGATSKLSAAFRGRPLALHAAQLLRDLEFGQLICVWSKATGPVVDAVSSLGYRMVEQPDPERGLGASLALGVKQATRSSPKAILVALADMPLVSRGHIMALLETFGDDADPVASSDGAVSMPPALFGSRHFGGLFRLEGDAGARHLLVGARLVQAVPGELADIDRPEDFTGSNE